MSPAPGTSGGRQATTGDRRPARRRVVALVLGGTTLLSLQGGLLRVALPAIRRDLGVGISGAQAVSLAGLVVVCSTLVAFGRLADLVGPRRVYAWGLVAFGAGAGLSVAAPDVGWLVLAQAAQGLGWSMSVASGTVLLVSVFDPAERARAVAANHVAVAVGLAAGPAVGGVVIDQFGWRWGFAALVPAALALAVVAAAGSSPPRDRGRAQFDLRGAVALAAALAAALSLIDAGARDRLGPGGVSVAAAASATALVVFIRLQLRAADPVLDLRLFARRGFSAGLAASFLNFVAMASNMFLLPFYLQDHRGLSAGRAGAVMLVMPVAIVVAAPLAGTFADRVSPRAPATAGLALIAAAVALMAAFSADTPLALVVVVLAVYGAGAGLFQSPNISAVIGSVAPGHFGVASASLATVARLGQVVGVAVAGGVWQWGLDRHGHSPGGQTAAFRLAFAVLAVFGVLAAVASWLRGPAEPAPGIAATAAVGQAGVQ
ncbi:MAG: MFS transporter [Acidimicrobiales bacterium]